MNLYCTLDDFKARPGAHQAAATALLLDLISGASRWIDTECCRHFHAETATRIFAVHNPARAWLDDVLAIEAVGADSEADETFDGEDWIEGTDYRLTPCNSWPKLALEPLPEGNYSLARAGRYLQITGTFGYGDGESSDPWAALWVYPNFRAVTGTVATVDGTTLTLSEADVVSPGMTLLLGAEQMFVAGVSGTAATVTRGVNGTTAAAHDAAALARALYPDQIRLATIQKAMDYWHELSRSGDVSTEWIGGYNFMRMSASEATARDRRMIGAYIRRV